MTQTLTITTKAKATAILNATPGARRFKYCAGKYHWDGSAKRYIGTTVERVSDEVKAIWVERRSDTDGPYACMMCITTA